MVTAEATHATAQQFEDIVAALRDGRDEVAAALRAVLDREASPAASVVPPAEATAADAAATEAPDDSWSVMNMRHPSGGLQAPLGRLWERAGAGSRVGKRQRRRDCRRRPGADWRPQRGGRVGQASGGGPHAGQRH